MIQPHGDDPNEPYPSVGGALMLTLLAIFAAGFTGVAFIDFGLLAAVGIGQAIGVGAVATLGAKRVPEPQAQRLGLRALDAEAIPVILCLVPAILLASELDNIAAEWSAAPTNVETIGSTASEPTGAGASDGDDYGASTGAAPSSEASGTDATASGPDADASPRRLIDPDDPASVLQAFVVMVGISPIVEEFLFRGVIQQSLVQRLGLVRGVSLVALLWTLLRPAPIAGLPRFFAAVVASFALGWALGIVRIATGSILGPILLASSWAAVGLGSLVLEGRMDLPGMNVEGTHLPILVTAASLLLVAWAGWTVYREAERRFEPAPPSAEPPGPEGPET